MDTRVVGAILTGGESRRMGADKATVELDGIPMGQRVAAALDDAGVEVVTVGGVTRIEGYESIPDPPGMHGPLAGLMSALEYAASRPVFTVAVDQPLLRTATVRNLISIETHDAVIPMADDYPQVICALYRATCLPAMRRITPVNPDASIRDLLGYVSVRYVDPAEWMEWGEDGRSWRSVDTPEDLAEVEQWLADN